jgi:hypothetical protein
VRDWEHFQALKSALAEQASFTVHRVHQRLIYPTPLAVIVDLIPFGGVEREDRTIAWPPDEDFVMRVAGFRDGLESSVPVRLAEELVVRVVSIPTLLLLKLFAWLDRTCVWAWPAWRSWLGTVSCGRGRGGCWLLYAMCHRFVHGGGFCRVENGTRRRLVQGPKSGSRRGAVIACDRSCNQRQKPTTSVNGRQPGWITSIPGTLSNRSVDCSSENAGRPMKIAKSAASLASRFYEGRARFCSKKRTRFLLLSASLPLLDPSPSRPLGRCNLAPSRS